MGTPFRHQFATRVRELRRKLGMSQQEMSEAVGRANNNSISRIEQAVSATIHMDVLERLARLAERCGFTREWLLSGQLVSGRLSEHTLQRAYAEKVTERLLRKGGLAGKALMEPPDLDIDIETTPIGDGQAETTLIEDGAAEKSPLSPAPSPPDGPAPTFRVARTMEPGYRTLDAEQLPADWQGRYVPIIGRLSAGDGVDTVEAEQTPPGWAHSYVRFEAPPPASFAVRIVGDSMEPDYRDGDIVVIDPAKPVKAGVCCVIYADAGDQRRAKLKKLARKRGRVVLESLNPAYRPVEIKASRLQAAYAVCAHLPFARR